ncbi:hypothetical protein ADL35_12315 [Streptomyces sp. NRRL WC-3753]|nr:hypothetical protein ADL35_12315 [Streptomyces sp. NRRL WC-3753]
MTKWSRLARTRVGYVTGCVGLAVGAAVQFGTGIGLMVGGALTAGSFLLLSDVDSEGGTDE